MIISLPLVPHKIVLQKHAVAIGVSWLFQISGILGVTLGFQEWFISKTPLNLTVQFCLLLWMLPFKNYRYQLSLAVAVLLGFSIEAIGTNFGFPFGAYEYGQNLGFKLFGVPILIAFNWALLGFLTAIISNSLHQSIWVRSAIGGLLMVILDIAIEVVAPAFDYWSFDLGYAPWNNYLCWFVIGCAINYLMQRAKIRGNRFFAINLYSAQFLFFLYFALIR